MTSLDDLARKYADLAARVTALEIGSPGPASTYGPNVISNGDMESGIAGWVDSFFIGTAGTASVETAAPLSGVRSLKMSEAANSSTRLTWNPNPGAPAPGVDVFVTSPGDIWLITATMQATITTVHAKIYAVCGTTVGDCYQLVGANTSWQAAADIPLTANQPTTLSGQITVPAGRNYLTFNCSPDDAAATSGVAWSWLLDDVTLQQKTN